MNKVFRINMKTDGNRKGQDELLNFCKSESIIGIGWSNSDFTDGLEYEENDVTKIQTAIQKYLKNNNTSNKKRPTIGFTAASNCLLRMEKGDYIWTRGTKNYALAKVTGGCKYISKKQMSDSDYKEYENYDIGFYIPVKYISDELTLNDVPGKVLASFRAPNTVAPINDNVGEPLLKYSDAVFQGTEVKFTSPKWETFLSADDIEEIVGLYLQVVKKLYIYTSTCKTETKTYEFMLVDKNGVDYALQVKTGGNSINGDDYKNEELIVYLFATSDKVVINNPSKLKHITYSEIDSFIKSHKNLLPSRVQKWLE